MDVVTSGRSFSAVSYAESCTGRTWTEAATPNQPGLAGEGDGDGFGDAVVAAEALFDDFFEDEVFSDAFFDDSLVLFGFFFDEEEEDFADRVTGARSETAAHRSQATSFFIRCLFLAEQLRSCTTPTRPAVVLPVTIHVTGRTPTLRLLGNLRLCSKALEFAASGEVTPVSWTVHSLGIRQTSARSVQHLPLGVGASCTVNGEILGTASSRRSITTVSYAELCMGWPEVKLRPQRRFPPQRRLTQRRFQRRLRLPRARSRTECIASSVTLPSSRLERSGRTAQAVVYGSPCRFVRRQHDQQGLATAGIGIVQSCVKRPRILFGV